MNIVETFKRFQIFPQGRKLFSQAVCFKAPYFHSIRPVILDLEQGYCRATIKKRRSVLNHIGTVHAIAVCNLCELVAGLCVDSSMKSGHRWIPKGMNVEYLKKCETDLIAEAKFPAESYQLGDNNIEVEVKDQNDQLVVRAIINMYISERPSKR